MPVFSHPIGSTQGGIVVIKHPTLAVFDIWDVRKRPIELLGRSKSRRQALKLRRLWAADK